MIPSEGKSFSCTEASHFTRKGMGYALRGLFSTRKINLYISTIVMTRIIQNEITDVKDLFHKKWWTLMAKCPSEHTKSHNSFRLVTVFSHTRSSKITSRGSIYSFAPELQFYCSFVHKWPSIYF